MARKKELIEAEWLRAETALVAAHKKCEAATFSDGDLADYKAKYAVWAKLLAEAQKKIGEWKNEKDPKRIAWMKLVQTRATRLNPGYIKEVEKAETKHKGAKALAEVMAGLDNNAVSALNKAEECLKKARPLVVKKDYDAAASEHGKALNYLKNAGAQVTKGGAAKAVADQARVKGVTAADVDTNNSAYKTKLKGLQDRYAHLDAEADELGDAIDKLEAEALNHRNVDSPNLDPQYKVHLKKCFDDYRAVLAFASKGLATLKQLEGNVPKLEAVVKRTVTVQTVPPVVNSALHLHKQMADTYKAVDKHIQETIRTTESSIVKQAAAWGITADDKSKNLMPVMNRAFSTNFQCKAIVEKAADRLQDSLEDLAKKFNSKEAAAGAQKLERGAG